MIEYSLADQYKKGGLNPGPDIINLRKEPFEKLYLELNQDKIITLVRVCYGLKRSGDLEWIRDAFANTDPSFTLVDNENEVAVLAAALLNISIKEKPFSCLALLCGSVAGGRKLKVRSFSFQEVNDELLNHSARDREKKNVDLKQLKIASKSKHTAAIEAIPSSNDWSKLADVIKQVSNESLGVSNSLGGILASLLQVNDHLQEEVDILWWHIGNWSRNLNEPFSDINLKLIPILAGIDLADLSRTISGPVAAPAILHKTLSLNKNTKTSAQITISEMANEYPLEKYECLKFTDNLKVFSDLCPVLYSIFKFNEIGDASAWEKSYKKDTEFDPQKKFSLLELGIQSYRERLFLNSIMESQ
ncbi:GTPase-associated system all-helical protein GASH [Leptospira sp. id769339]|uniref:GTPase-associated system all-helical protein GASH n=1 Tax=Leptospira sp. id769339 TaxID=2864221 RepID=UPI00214B4FE7|nr:GTPase-associated system all-helical protein GASH [Leptospira sp. id769339]MCR1795580.1 hypothetical protein [Leptospira sp. id769339]